MLRLRDDRVESESRDTLPFPTEFARARRGRREHDDTIENVERAFDRAQQALDNLDSEVEAFRFPSMSDDDRPYAA